MTLYVVPLTLKEANNIVSRLHRHHKPVVGHRFSIGVKDSMGRLRGAAIVGRPVARKTNWHIVAEVTRLVTDGTKNACSILYAAAARTAKAMGFERIQSFILEEEPGTSLDAAGWTFDGVTTGGDWNSASHQDRRTDQPMTPKRRYVKHLNSPPPLRTVHPWVRVAAWNAAVASYRSVA